MTTKISLSALLLVASAACGGGSSSSSDGGTSNSTTFALTIDLHSVQFGMPHEDSWAVAVRADDGTLVAYEDHQAEPTQTADFKLVIPNLRTDTGYKVGIATSYVPTCVSNTYGLWYEHVTGVTGDTTLSRMLTVDEGNDTRACDVFHEPVKLDPGVYKNSSTILGSGQNGVELVVSASHRVYVTRAFVLCRNPASGCYPSLTSWGPTCGNGSTPAPGSASFSLGGSGSATKLEGTATIDPATMSIKWTGTTTTYKSSTPCCTDSFDVTLTRTGDATTTCP